jgi:hypothetical protein
MFEHQVWRQNFDGHMQKVGAFNKDSELGLN